MYKNVGTLLKHIYNIKIKLMERFNIEDITISIEEMINFIFKRCGESVDKDTIAMILDIQEEFLASYDLIDIDEDNIY